MSAIVAKDLDDLIWFTTGEAATYSRCHQQTVTDALRAGTLVGSQPFGKNGRWRIHRDNLDAWLRGESA